ncbi:MAG: thioredoxin domain-containing protein [Candidatus Binatus sp.]
MAGKRGDHDPRDADRREAAREYEEHPRSHRSLPRGIRGDHLRGAVRPTGLSREKAMACLKDQSKADAMQKIVKTAEDVVKVQGTPTFVIDGKVYGGELTMADLDAILKPLVK